MEQHILMNIYTYNKQAYNSFFKLILYTDFFFKEGNKHLSWSLIIYNFLWNA